MDFTSGDIFTDIANAQLLAAAPELLSALQYISSCAPEGATDGDPIELAITPEGLRDLRALINKALGKP